MRKVKIILFIIVIIATSLLLFFKYKSIPLKTVRRIPGEGGFTGGGCTYKKFNGTCTITKIEKTDKSTKQVNRPRGPGYEGFEVKYKYSPTILSKLRLKLSNFPYLEDNSVITNMEYHLNLGDGGTYVGEKYLEKYDIYEGKLFNCEASIETSGTCSPLFVSLDGVSRTDFFESTSQ